MKYINPLNGKEYSIGDQYIAEASRSSGRQTVQMTIPTLDSSAEEFLAAMHKVTYEVLQTVNIDYVVTKDRSFTSSTGDNIVIHWDVGETPSKFMFKLIIAALDEVYKDPRYNLLRFTRGENPVGM